MMKESSVNEIIQGIGRARAVRALEPIDVLLLTDMVIPDLVPDVIEQWSEFRKTEKQTKIAGYLARELAGDGIQVAVLNSDVMCRQAPDMFQNIKSAEKARAQLPAEINAAFVRGCLDNEFTHNLKPPSPLIREEIAGDTILEVRGGLDYGKSFGIGTARPIEAKRHSTFLASLSSNDHTQIYAALCAKFTKPIIEWTFSLFDNHR